MGQQVAIPLADNANLVANALDYLVGSEALHRPARPRGDGAAVHAGGRDPARQRGAVPGQGAGAAAAAGRAAGQAQLAARRARATITSLLSDAQRKEIDGFRSQLLDTRRELRDVQLALRQDIEQLRDRTRFLNIAAVPLLVRCGGDRDGAGPARPLPPPFRPGARLSKGRHARCRPGTSPSSPLPPR